VDHYTAAVSEVPAFEGLQNRPDDDGATNILVVGSDDRAGLSTERRLELKLGLEDFGRHTDTMLLVHITSDGAVDVVSIPRDSAVTIPAHEADTGEDIEEYRGKINASYSSGGPQLLVETVEQATSVHVDHYVEVSFEGFVDIVNALGGVEVCTEEPIYDELSGLDLPAGTSVVDGDMGLSYVRAKAASASVLLNPFRANSTVNAALSSVSADPALSDSEVKRILQQLRNTTPSDITFHSVPVAGEEYLYDGSLAVVWDRAGSQAMFDALQQDRSVAQVLGQDEAADEAEIVGPPRAQIPVVVLNGNGTPGIATDAGNGMAAVGHPVVMIGNADVVERSQIAYPPGSKEQAEKVAQMLPGADVVESDEVTDVTITLGTDFTDLADVPNEAKTPNGKAGPVGGTGFGSKTGADSICS
jgi:LCP family protein required for cell wall assembly